MRATFDAAACTRLLPEHRHGAGGNRSDYRDYAGVCRRACLGQFQQTRIQASSLLPPEHVLFGVVKWKLDVQLYWLDTLHSLQKVY